MWYWYLTEDIELHHYTPLYPVKLVSNAAEDLETWKTKLLSLLYPKLFPMVCQKNPDTQTNKTQIKETWP